MTRVLARIHQAGLAQADLAAVCGVTTQRISQIVCKHRAGQRSAD